MMCFTGYSKVHDPPERSDHYNSRPVEVKTSPKRISKMPEYAPPPGPPQFAAYESQPSLPPNHKVFHDWQTAVPDTSHLPPPPRLGNQQGAINNASEQEAQQGEDWCAQNPVTGPVTLSKAVLESLAAGNIGVVKPRSYQANLDFLRPGVWAVKCKPKSPDCCISTPIPLYSVIAHSPMKTQKPMTVYYEVRISPRSSREVSLALGFVASPYPTFRLPGWHRGSLAVHGDDGSRFINDRWGGKDFTQPFRPGDTVGIGMTFTARDLDAPPAYGSLETTMQTPIDVQVFFTRNGVKDGSWNLHEEGDSEEDLPVTGLEGFHDLYAAVGTFDSVQFEIVFNHDEWVYLL